MFERTEPVVSDPIAFRPPLTFQNPKSWCVVENVIESTEEE